MYIVKEEAEYAGALWTKSVQEKYIYFFFFFFNVNQALSPYFPKVYILNPIENAYYHVYNELWTDLGDLLILRKHAVWNCL